MSKFLDGKQLCAELGISPVTTTRLNRNPGPDLPVLPVRIYPRR